jgi:hypothetical protein
MEQWLRTLGEFYKNNQTLVVALVSLIGGWLLNKLWPAIWSFILDKFGLLRKKIGGNRDYHRIEGEYLNWVVHTNKDLNLLNFQKLMSA